MIEADIETFVVIGLLASILSIWVMALVYGYFD
jgi:hypothetical protein